MDTLLETLRAAAEHTRLRILWVLRTTELTVGELCTILDQSQPRVSRHLRLLHEGGLVERAAEGTSAYYGLTSDPSHRALLDVIFERVPADDPQAAADDSGVERVRQQRRTASAEYFDTVASEWDAIRPLHVADEAVEQALLAEIGERRACLVDIGTGTGRMLELFADRVDRAIGIDTSVAMLRAARGHLDPVTMRHCSVQRGNAEALDLPDQCADLVVLHHVLHFLERPEEGVREAARILQPGGLLLIVDFAPHRIEALRTSFAHRHLGFSDHDVADLVQSAGLHTEAVHHVDADDDQALGTFLWRAVHPSDLPIMTTRSR